LKESVKRKLERIFLSNTFFQIGAITTAILRCGEPSCHITAIYEFVARVSFVLNSLEIVLFNVDKIKKFHVPLSQTSAC
jgi:hypothetical protein